MSQYHLNNAFYWPKKVSKIPAHWASMRKIMFANKWHAFLYKFTPWKKEKCLENEDLETDKNPIHVEFMGILDFIRKNRKKLFYWLFNNLLLLYFTKPYHDLFRLFRIFHLFLCSFVQFISHGNSESRQHAHKTEW